MASAALIVGRESGDEVTVNNGTATFADKNVGNNKTVIFSGFSLGGADAGNYTLSAQPTATANIFAKPITISSPSRVDNKVYDGTTTATINRFAIIGINDVISGDTVTANNGTATFADKNVGNNKTVTFSGFSLGGADAGNYSLSAQPASVTANITAKSVTITGLTAANKVYDRTTTATRTGTATINGLIGGDTVTVNNGTVAFENATVGNNKTVIFSGFSLGGTDGGNYSLSAQPTATANITAKPVTITGLTAANKQYDGTTTATRTGTATLNGVISGDTVTINYGTAAFASATAGNNKTVTFSGFSLGGASAGNYSLSAQPASVTANITVIAIDMVRLSNGSNVTFQMGSPTTEAGRNDENETRHQVTLATGFYMGKYQVTQTQYQMVMGNNPSSFTSGANTGEIQEKRPVERVSWYDAIAFCNKLSMLEGYTPAYRMNGTTNPDADAWGTGSVEIVANSTGYRLPTEAQWEYACRAGTTTAYHTGASISDTTGWYNGNGGNKTHEVGKKTANTLGLYDMHGNVAEWCWDWYADNYGGTGAQTNPTGPSSGTNRVRRGGSFSDSAANVRSASRSFAPQTGIYNIIGFRLVRP
jgi:formylglycine-generating enzyme required for sulfatase activity